MRKSLVLVVLALAVLALLLAGEAVTWAQKGPIKVGLLVPQTGPLAANGKDMINDLELFFEQVNYRLAGREIKLIIEDDEGKPATGLTKARGLVEGQGVHLVTGPLSAAVGYAVASYVDSKKVPTIYRSSRPRTSPSASAASTSCAPAGRVASPRTPLASGCTTIWATRRSR